MPDRDDELSREVFRLRERLHKSESTTQGLLWRVERLEKRCDNFEPRISKLDEQAMIAEAISAKARGHREETDLRLTRTQKILGMLGGLLIAADTIRGFLGH